MRLIEILFLTLIAQPASAQTAPTPEETPPYTGHHLAAHTGDTAAIRQMAAAGEDLDITVENGRTAAHIAAFASHDDALRALAEGGADLNLLDDQRYDVLTIAAVANDADMVRLALELGNRADLITSVYDGTALIAAAHLGHDTVVQHLINGGAPLNHVNNLGWTALMEAVVLGDGGPRHQRTVAALLAAGADRMIPDRRGLTPLDHAELLGYVTIADMLRRTD